MSRTPDVTIVIPAYNRPDLLPLAVKSCAESGPGLELQIVVIDDGSSEDLTAVAFEPSVEYERFAVNSGSAAARNRGLELARGRYVKFLDSDDILTPGSLRREYGVAQDHNADIVVADWCTTRMSPDGRDEHIANFVAPSFGSIVDDLLAGRAVPTSAALYAERIARRTQWDPQLITLHDWDYFISAALCATRIVTVTGTSYCWRQHSGSRITSSTSFVENATAFYIILSKLGEYLESRRLLTQVRKERLAQYLYKELRGLYRFRSPDRHFILARIRELDSWFVPRDEERSRALRWLAHVLPLSWLLNGYGVARGTLDRVSRRSHA